MIDAAEFATFMVAEDADEIVKAMNRLRGPVRDSVLAHMQVLVATIERSRPTTEKPNTQLLIAAAPKNRSTLLKLGPFISETPEGRVLERKHRAHKVIDIARAEFPDLDPVIGVARVREIIAKAKSETKGRSTKRSKIIRRAPATVEPLKRRVVELRQLRITTGRISKAIGEPAFFVTRAIAEAKSKGVVLPDADAKERVPAHLNGRDTIEMRG
jgi:hypothetical protein